MNVKPQALYLQTTTPFLPPRSASHSIAGRRASLRRSVPSPPLPFLRRSSLRLSRNPTREVASEVVGGVRFDGPVVEIGEISEVLDGDLAVEICITRALPPAVTLEQGIGRIREAVETLKLDPPSSSSGFLRFQVAVPPSAKALNWFCSQPDSSLVFPLFFVSKDTNEPSCKSLLLNETRGVFGIGASVYFERDSCSALGEMAQSKRYLSSESTPVLAYGFVDSSFDKELSVIKHEAGSYYFFIPQIELDECQGFSVLSATLVWCDSCLLTFEKAFHSFELSLVQATSHFWSTAEKCCTRNIVSSLRKLNLVEDGIIPKVYMRALSQGRMYAVDGIKEMREAPSSRQFCLRLSPTVVVASNMLNPTTGVGFSVQHCANINAVWASLIIEECFRLGLTYFCVAPGSRSSPLTVAASTHPLITCIVCFDERSLAFHAVGYARGSRKPAVVITSSGTAVSNLLPAVVEAYQDFVPLLLLTADRPPELLDAGANQAIDQGKHFGSFVRFFFSLPAPTDCIPARMVLTTIDSAVHWASFAPGGPVHVNCPFREPLENSPCKWTPSCLQGLDFWMSSAEPFTKYFDVNGAPCDDNPNEISEVINLMQQVSKGILLIGEIRTVDEIWALLLLAKHLSWPVVADILSGLRLRKIWTSFPDAQDHITFIDHLDHALVSDLVRDWTNADVIIQIGSRMTSKRVSKMLEGCFPCSYIMVDNHPFRYDPSHIVTHRIQSSIITFANYLLKFEFSHKKNGWSIGLQAVNLMVARELSFQIFSENSLTEPQVANIVSEALSSQSALFIGNSMPIRDADMYGSGWSRCIHKTSAVISNLELFAHLIWIVGNRGASGIDGLVSTAVGFAVGCNKRVICVVGDISFLHDTNGLAILSQRVSRKPMTIVVINNHGGAIFSLLPIAERIEESILNKYFCTSHNISIRGLCMAHGVKHLEIQTKAELNDALFMSQPEEMDFVIEVVSSIEANATFHSTLRKFACQAADHTLRFFLRLPVKDSVPNGFSSCKVQSIKYLTFRIPLCAPPTMTTVDFKSTSFYREGFILSLSLEDGCVGFGEVSPLDISKENLIDVEEQLRFLLHKMNGVEISCLLPLLKGSFSSWIWTNLGILPVSLFPSVRCGLEMAILNALAARLGVDLLSLLCVQKGEEALPGASSKVKVCALVDSDGTPTEVADIVAKLVEEGFTAIKLKVARCRSPTQDAEVMHEVRKMVGHRIELRVDANRNWTYEEAIRFGSFVKDCGLQYIEEPVKDEGDIIKFCEETGLPVALDETIDNIQENLLNTLMKYTHQGIVAVVIKPSVVGGFENAALIAQWAQQHGKMAVISSTFESGLGLAAYIHLSCYLDQKNAEICKLMNKEMGPSVAHGLGTYSWLKEDVATTRLEICRNQYSGVIEVSTSNANKLLQSFQINHNTICGDHLGEEVRRYQVPVYLDGIHYQIKVQEMGQESHGNVIVFLHGFLGTSEDWTSIMKAVSRGERCISIDLPGHGDTQIQKHGDKDVILEPSLSIEVVADIVYEVIHSITQDMITIVGYSMGARIALYMALRFTDKVKVNGAVVISGSPGMKDEVARKVRRATDDSRAQLLVSYGLGFFLDTWYSGKLWNSLRDHPKFNQIVRSRLHHHQDIPNLAKVLSDSSIGRQLPLWDDLKHCKTPLLIITGDRDEKFKRIAQDMCYAIDGAVMSSDGIYETVKIPNCGHAVHIENPLPVIRALRRFLSRLETSSNAFVGQLKN